MGGKPSKPIDLDYGHELDQFACQYIGSVPVKAPTGNDVCQNAVERILALKPKLRMITLKVRCEEETKEKEKKKKKLKMLMLMLMMVMFCACGCCDAFLWKDGVCFVGVMRRAVSVSVC